MFAWDSFFRQNGLNENSTADQWLARIGDAVSRPTRLALRFMALVNFFDRQEGDRNNTAAAQRVLRITLRDAFGFGVFPNTREDLRNGLLGLGVRLRVGDNGDMQYIRTIMYYSGWMYADFAHLVGDDIRRRSWEVATQHNNLDRLLCRRVERLNAGGRANENRLQLEDVIAFFQSLARLYRRYNAPFTVEDVQALAPLKRTVAQQIINELCRNENPEEGGEGGRLNNLETLPRIDLNEDGQVVFTLPREGHFQDRGNTVVFLFKEQPGATGEPFEHRAYNRDGDGRYRISDEIPVLLNGARKVRSIMRLEPGSEQEPREVLPHVFFELGRTHLLLKLRDCERNRCGYRLDSSSGDSGIVPVTQKLERVRRYKVVPINGECPEVVIFGEDGRRETVNDAENSFLVPIDAEAVSIGADTYEVKTAADTYLYMYDRLRVFDNPNRLFFASDKCPFTDVCRQDGVVARYVLDDGHQIELPFENWQFPAEALWRSGSLEMWDGDRRLFRRAVTFVDGVDCVDGVDLGPFDIDEERQVGINIGDETVQVPVPPRVTRVVVPYRGFRLSIPVKRTGVYFECNNQIVTIPHEEPGHGRILDLARKDFERLQCRIVPESDLDTVYVIRGNTAQVPLDKREWSFTGSEINEMLGDSSSDYYAICIKHIDAHGRTRRSFYKFHVYDPERMNVAAEDATRHSVIWRRDEATDDLVLTYWLPYCDQEKQKYLTFFPAHKQDEQAICFETEPCANYVHETDPETGRCRETVRLPGFFRRSIDWGRGVICFVASRQTNFGGRHSYEVLTSGFLLPAPPDMVTEINDDPYGLRAAFAGDENCREDRARILEIMTSPNPEVQAYVSGFLERMKNAVSELNAFKYLNAYWNQIACEDGHEITSGYAFMAAAYYSRVVDTPAGEAYRGLWSRRLIPYGFIAEQPPLQLDPTMIPHLRQEREDVGLDDPSVLSRPLMSEFWKAIKMNVDPQVMRQARAYYIRKDNIFSYPQLAEAVRRKFERNVPLNELLNALPEGQDQEAAKETARGVLTALYEGWRQVDAGEIDIQEITGYDGEVYQAVCRLLPDGWRAAQWAKWMFRPVFNNFKETPYLYYAGYDEDIQRDLRREEDGNTKRLDPATLVAFVHTMGQKLHAWRSNQTLEDAQDLRKTFITVEKVDARMACLPQHPVCNLMDAIENEAWRCRAEVRARNEAR